MFDYQRVMCYGLKLWLQWLQINPLYWECLETWEFPQRFQCGSCWPHETCMTWMVHTACINAYHQVYACNHHNHPIRYTPCSIFHGDSAPKATPQGSQAPESSQAGSWDTSIPTSIFHCQLLQDPFCNIYCCLNDFPQRTKKTPLITLISVPR